MLKFSNFNFWTKTIILDSSSKSLPSAPSLSSSISESQTALTSQPRNVNTQSPCKRLKSHILDTSSTTSSRTLFPQTNSSTNPPPISEIPITSRSQPLPLLASVFEIPEPKTVARLVNYRQPTAFKTIRQQPQLDIVHIPNFVYLSLPSLQLTSETESSIRSKLHPLLKPFRKPSTSLSNLLETTSQETEYIPESQSFFWSLNIETILDLFLHADLVLIALPHIFHHYQITLLFDSSHSTTRTTPFNRFKYHSLLRLRSTILFIWYRHCNLSFFLTFKQHTFLVISFLKYSFLLLYHLTYNF